MSWEECVDEPVGRARHSVRASVFACVYSIAAYLSFMSAAAPELHVGRCCQRRPVPGVLAEPEISRQKMFDRTNAGV